MEKYKSNVITSKQSMKRTSSRLSISIIFKYKWYFHYI
jgi:hypothetical protein